jgi:hypothetical protein
MILSNIQEQIDDINRSTGDGVMVLIANHRDCKQWVYEDCQGKDKNQITTNKEPCARTAAYVGLDQEMVKTLSRKNLDYQG